MAAQQDLQKMLERMRNPGMGVTSNNEQDDSADARNRRALQIMGTDSAVRRPGMTAGRSSVPTGSPAGRLAGDLNTLRSPTQMNRQSAEMDVNPLVANATRQAYAEQQRLRSGLRGPGRMNPVEYRAHLAAMNQNQQSINSNLQAVGQMRDASVTERGQNLQATTALRDRQMAEAGDFDQALLGIDEAMLRGQYGLAGIQAEQNDPVAMAMLNAANAAVGDDPTKSELMGMANLFGGQGGMTPAAASTGTITAPWGEMDVPMAAWANEYARRNNLEGEAAENFYNMLGLTQTEQGMVPLTPEIIEDRQQQAEAAKAEQDAAAEAERKRQSEALRKRLNEGWTPIVGGM